MNLQNPKGFTIIEVVLFLALSAAFLAVAFAGISGRTQNLRFTDSMRSLENYITSERGKVVNGVNSTTVSACDKIKPTGKNESCILVGRILTFTDLSSDIKANVMYGDKKSTAETKTDVERLRASNPRSDTTEGLYTIEWGTHFVEDKSTQLNGSTILGIGWMRAPNSTSILPVIVNSKMKLSSNSFVDQSDNYQIDTDVIDTKLCFASDDGNRHASINFDKYSNVSLVFDDKDCK